MLGLELIWYQSPIGVKPTGIPFQSDIAFCQEDGHADGQTNTFELLETDPR